MKKIRIEHNQLPGSVINALASRDIALWLGKGVAGGDESKESLRKLIGLPWKLVLSEENNTSLIESLESNNSAGGPLNRKRGFIHLIASDPEGTQLPPRALPVFLLNGREKPRQPEESAILGALATMRRRLNMLNELVAARPKMVLIVSSGSDQPLSDFISLWKEENFRPLFVILSSSESDITRVDNWLLEPNSPQAVDHSRTEINKAVSDLVGRVELEIPDTRLTIRIKGASGEPAILDITDAELIERPITEGYDLIQAKDLGLLQPDELSKKDFEDFFNKSQTNWKPFAAGLPWQRNVDSKKTLLNTLKKVAEVGPSENQVFTITSDSGAGGTTFARMLAFEAASEGYPVLLAKPSLPHPEVLELSRFLYRSHLVATESGLASTLPQETILPIKDKYETPWLLVFDVHHWQGKYPELRNFLTALTKDGRPVVILAVTTPFAPAELSSSSRIKRIASLTHELNLTEALKLGEHLNRYLKPHGQDRSEHQWRHFWEAHRPDHINAAIAHFWIALEFWLQGQFDLNQSVQSWLYDSFKKADISDDVRLLLLEIAALSMERQPLPEGLMPLSPRQQRPDSVILEEVRMTVPALALVRDETGLQKVWAMAHDLLGRYLVSSTFYDHAMLERLGLDKASDPVQLRLSLLNRITSRSSLALPPYRRLALDFAVKILKLDADGNQEFVLHWRQVLEMLSNMPSGIRETSRAFNHHVAISLRRVVKHREFGIQLSERKSLLERAIGHLEYALNDLQSTDGDESNLNLFNSLALAYQDLADVERESGAPPDQIEALRLKATEATRKALQEDPTNSYVLETNAKNLIQNGEHYPDKAVPSATEALGYIYQAVSLERSEFRQSELTRLANRALQLLRLSGAKEQVSKLTKSGNPLGALAEAWIVLTEGITDLTHYDLQSMPQPNVTAALNLLEKVSEKSNWMILRFRYDLVTVSRPADFDSQLRLLDELEGTGYRMPLQAQLEYAILLHQQSRHLEANRKFRNLRQDLRKYDAIVEVPRRLFWLLVAGSNSRRIFEAQVVESRSHRAVAKLRELKDELVPFVPQEFGVQEMRVGTQFKCTITFGRMGPFLKPPQASHEN